MLPVTSYNPFQEVIRLDTNIVSIMVIVINIRTIAIQAHELDPKV